MGRSIMTKVEYLKQITELTQQLEESDKFEVYYLTLETLIYKLEEEIQGIRYWIKNNPELTLNNLEAEGYLRGLLFMKKMIQAQECSSAIYRLMESELDRYRGSDNV
jgi:hypothetical protein